MMRTSGAKDLVSVQEASIRVLAGLYRSTFVEKMQEHLQSMLAGAYTVYVTGLEEGFDPILRAHLADVLQDVVARASELADVFQEELMRYFRKTIEQADILNASNGCISESKSNFCYRVDDDAEVREFVARTIRSIETRHGSIILAVTKTYVKLANQSVEDFRPPWTPAKLFSAFGVVLQQIDVPIHGRIKLVFYKMFSQEVLRHFGDACLAFRDMLPETQAELRLPDHDCALPPVAGSEVNVSSVGPNFRMTATPAPDSPSPTLALTFSREKDGLGMVSSPSELPASASDGFIEKKTRVISEAGSVRKLVRVGFVVLGGVAVVCSGWWIGAYFAEAWSLPNGTARIPAGTETLGTREAPMQPLSKAPGASETSSRQSPAKEASSSRPPPVQVTPSSSELESAATDPAPPIPREIQPSPYVKRDAMRGIKLKHFSWRADSGGNELLFDLTISNTTKIRVGGIEVVCSQYSETLDFLEAGKTVLAGPVEPDQARTFKAVPIGFASKQAKRVNCVIADLDMESVQ